MRISRLYLPDFLGKGMQIELDEVSAHYVRTVLRLKKAASITVFNGEGGEWLGTITEVHRKRVVLSIDQWIDRSVESVLRVNLGLSIARSDRMDLAVQKAVELGANKITPLITEHSVVKLRDEKKQHKQQHWWKIAQHAAEQSGRTGVPELEQTMDLQKWLVSQDGLKIFLDPYAALGLPQLQPVRQQVTLLSGPEGGFSADEREKAKSAGFIPVRLGQRILRTETASLAALAAVQVLWGDFA